MDFWSAKIFIFNSVFQIAKKILIVEYEKSLLKLESILLTSNGFHVEGVTTGTAALQAAVHVAPDLVLLNVMLPGLDGFEVCKQIKNHPKTRHIPLIMLTARKEPEDVLHGKQVGADQYITKPFRSAMVVESIKRLV